ncbi:MAG: site-specific integrase [Spirosomataceae bacterium]
MTKNPYQNFTFKFTKTQRDFLTEDEFEKLQNHSLGDNLSLQKVRDIYMFSVYTGLRFGDAINLKTENIINEKDGGKWIQIIQEKTKEPFRVPMLNHAIHIMRKYESESKITGYVLARISHQKLNSYLKVIAAMVGISKNLTHHTARHTFATTIALNNEVPMEIVSRMLGHTNIRTTQIYAKITTQYLKEHTDKLNKKLSK